MIHRCNACVIYQNIEAVIIFFYLKKHLFDLCFVRNIKNEMSIILKINEQNPQKRLINKAIEIIEQGGVIIYPTDTVYAYGCSINKKKAIERIYSIKKIPKNKPLSFIFSDISELHEYVRNISNHAFKIMKKAFPGPYTFIFQASRLI